MIQELTFERWVIEGYKYARFGNESVICLKSLNSNMHKVLSEGVFISVKKYTDVFHQRKVELVANEPDMLEKLRLLRRKLDYIKESEEKSTLVFGGLKSEFEEKDFCSICVSRAKTALDMLSRYLRGFDKKYANQAEYIRLVYKKTISEKRKTGVTKFTEKVRISELKLVSPKEEAYNSVEAALDTDSYKNIMRISKVIRREDEISIYFSRD